MNRKIILSAALGTVAMLGTTTPANATWFSHSHYCNCGHSKGGKSCGSTSSSTSSGNTTTTTSSGGNPPPSGTTTTSGNTTSGGTTSSGGTAVPEPGVLGMMGLGLVGLAVARRRKNRR